MKKNMKIIGQLLELFKGCIIQLIYLYDLQIHREPSLIMYKSYNDTSPIIFNDKEVLASFNVNNINRINLGAIVPVTISIDSDNEIISDTIKKYNSIMDNKKFCIALLNTLLSIDICFNNHFDIHNDISEIINNSYTLTSKFINKLVNILKQFINLDENDRPIVRIANNINNYSEDNIKYILGNCITVVATCNILGISVFSNVGQTQNIVSAQFIAQIPLIIKEIKQTDLYSSELEQIQKLISLKQNIFQGTLYNFFKVNSECITLFSKEQKKCSFYVIKKNEFQYTVSDKNKINVTLQDDTKIRKIFKKLNNYCDYIRFLSEFHRLFTGDIIDIQNIDTQKINTTKQLLDLYNNILNQIYGKSTDSQTDIDAKLVQLLFNKLAGLCSKYLREYDEFFNKKVYIQKNTSVFNKYSEKLKKYTTSFTQGKNTTDFSGYVTMFIKWMKFAFKTYKLREIIVNYSETNTPNIRNNYNGTKNNINKLRLQVGEPYFEPPKKNTVLAITHKPTVPHKPNLFRTADKRKEAPNPTAVAPYKLDINTNPGSSITPSVRKSTIYNTIKSNFNKLNAPLPPLSEQKTKKEGFLKKLKLNFKKLAEKFRKTKKVSLEKIPNLTLKLNSTQLQNRALSNKDTSNAKLRTPTQSIKSSANNYSQHSSVKQPYASLKFSNPNPRSSSEEKKSSIYKTVKRKTQREPHPLPPRTQRSTFPLPTSISQKQKSHSSKIKEDYETRKIGKAKFNALKAIFEKKLSSKKRSIVPRALRLGNRDT